MSIPQTQVAYGFKRGDRSIHRFENVPVKEPKQGEVLLEVMAVGLCQSDLHILKAQEEHIPEEFIMGHEIAGRIIKVGAGLENSQYKVGNRYVVTIANTCGTCVGCRAGIENACTGRGPYGVAFGINSDGGYQRYLLIDNVRALIPFPDDISYEVASVATDSVLTAFHAVTRVKERLGPASKVLLIGLGGLGLNALQILRELQCHVVAIDVKPDSEQTAKKFGAKEWYTTATKSAHQAETFDVVFDFVGAKATFWEAQKYVKSQGLICMIGLAQGKLELGNYDLARREVTVLFNFGGRAIEQIELLKWIQQGRIKPEIQKAPLSYLPEAIERMKRREITGRIVFDPSKTEPASKI